MKKLTSSALAPSLVLLAVSFVLAQESRECENGLVVYNPMGNKVVSVTFPDERRSAATGQVAQSHELKSPDGDLFLKVK